MTRTVFQDRDFNFEKTPNTACGTDNIPDDLFMVYTRWIMPAIPGIFHTNLPRDLRNTRHGRHPENQADLKTEDSDFFCDGFMRLVRL
jgi:hypothetical protein